VGNPPTLFIGMTNLGLNEKKDYLEVTVIHALIHSGGIPGKSIPYFKRDWEDIFGGLRGFVPPDLHYLGKKYDTILEKCIQGGNKSKVKRAASYDGRVQ
jgi:hypothetical protein